MRDIGELKKQCAKLKGMDSNHLGAQQTNTHHTTIPILNVNTMLEFIPPRNLCVKANYKRLETDYEKARDKCNKLLKPVAPAPKASAGAAPGSRGIKQSGSALPALPAPPPAGADALRLAVALGQAKAIEKLAAQNASV